jgi:hypothetical protein
MHQNASKNYYNVFQIPLATSMWDLVLPHFGLGLGIGIVDSSLMPLLATLVDEEGHGSGYGSVYAIAQTAVSLAYRYFYWPPKLYGPPYTYTIIIIDSSLLFCTVLYQNTFWFNKVYQKLIKQSLIPIIALDHRLVANWRKKLDFQMSCEL